jgi:hypothetical protein
LRNIKRYLLEYYTYYRYIRDIVVEYFRGLDITYPEEVLLLTSVGDVIESL